MNEDEAVPISPKDVAYTLLHEITAQIETLRSRPEEERGVPDPALTEQWIQFRQRSFDLLDQESHGEITTELLDANWEYHNSLFLKLASSYALDAEPDDQSGRKPMTGLAREAMLQVRDALKGDELVAPAVDDYVEKLPTPYGDLLGMLFMIDTALQQGRINVARDSFHKLL